MSWPSLAIPSDRWISTSDRPGAGSGRPKTPGGPGKISQTVFFRTASVGALAVVSALFLLKTGSDYSRGSVMIFALLSPLFVLAERTLLAGALARAIEADVIRGKRVVLIGDRWKVSRATWCGLVAGGGVICPPPP